LGELGALGSADYAGACPGGGGIPVFALLL